MAWTVLFATPFVPEFEALSRDVRRELLAQANILALLGPPASRPHVDTLKGSRHANMKELRFKADNGVWRAVFAFDPDRRAIILVAGDKAGRAQATFYRRLIAQADTRYDSHLASMGSTKGTR